MWIQTLEGSKFDLLNPQASAVCAGTICNVLARICRFGGHCLEFYSVAQHSVFVCDLVGAPHLKLPALLHDAHEAYTGFGDVCRPAKDYAASRGFSMREHERRIDAAIAEKFGFDVGLFYHPDVKSADNVALATEQRDIMADPPEPWTFFANPSPHRVEPLSTNEALWLFQNRLHELAARTTTKGGE